MYHLTLQGQVIKKRLNYHDQPSEHKHTYKTNAGGYDTIYPFLSFQTLAVFMLLFVFQCGLYESMDILRGR